MDAGGMKVEEKPPEERGHQQTESSDPQNNQVHLQVAETKDSASHVHSKITGSHAIHPAQVTSRQHRQPAFRKQ